VRVSTQQVAYKFSDILAKLLETLSTIW